MVNFYIYGSPFYPATAQSQFPIPYGSSLSDRVFHGDLNKVFYVVIRKKHQRKKPWKTWNQNIKFDKMF